MRMIIFAFLVGILACGTRAFAEDIPAPAAAAAWHAVAALSKEDFFHRLEELHALGLKYMSANAAKARRNARRVKNFFTPGLYPLVESLLGSYSRETIGGLHFSIWEKQRAIRGIFDFLPFFKKQSNNSQIDKDPHQIHRCARYRLVSYCFEAFQFEVYDEAGRIDCSHASCIVGAFRSMSVSVTNQALYLNMAMVSGLKVFLATTTRDGLSGPHVAELDRACARCDKAVQRLCKRKEIGAKFAKKRWSETAKTPEERLREREKVREERLKGRAEASKKRMTYVMEAADPSAFDWEPPCFGEEPGGVDLSLAGAAVGGAGDDSISEMPGEAENKRARVGSEDAGSPEEEE